MKTLRNIVRGWASQLLALAGLWIFVGLVLNGISLVIRNELFSPIFASFGTALFVAFLSYVLATNTSKEAFRDQNAKDARLNDKNKYYAPLNNELAVLIDICKNAELGQTPYPQTISLKPGDIEAKVPSYVPLHTHPAFHGWGEFKRDASIVLRFSSELQTSLDAVEKAVQDYNDALARFTQAVEQTLEHSITSARRDIMETPTREWKGKYLAWQTARHEQRQKGLQPSPSPDDWFTTIEDPITSANIAYEWVNGFQMTGYLPNTIGWLVAGNLRKAAEEISDYFKNSLGPDARLHLQEWIENGVFKRVDGVYLLSPAEVRQALGQVIIKAESARSELLHKISIIQELYEGGPSV